MPHFVATLVRHLRSRIVGGVIPQVSSAVAHSTRVLNMFFAPSGQFYIVK